MTWRSAEAAYVLGVAAFWQADFPTARRWFELRWPATTRKNRRAHLLRFGQDRPVSWRWPGWPNTLVFLDEPTPPGPPGIARVDCGRAAGHPPNGPPRRLLPRPARAAWTSPTRSPL
jgi:hypothetical protein